ncbi:gamma-tubulin ring complex protein [Lentinus tigrinus ALCF2SS1-7]|uniref:gamma-tubulin ring complex protein n=1 Tax=Lentinus tigrinus ALCF2SS1-7 TaxID=1328758 RepID=UPI001165C9F3|nr:gamma-tubulin ring complex protein [Lentinus tigrinus ALCF2SS1-7]
MIAEVLLVLAGHKSSLFPTDHTVHPAFAPLLHPGEEQCLESLGQIALRYRKIKHACTTLARPSSRYVSALCATLNQILKDEYEVLVVETEAKVLQRDSSLVASGSFVPLSSLRAIFSEWDAPLASLETLVDELQAQEQWKPGPLIDLLLTRSKTGIHRVSAIYARLSEAVQHVWIAQLQALLIHGTLSAHDPLADEKYVLVEGAAPSCVSTQSRESITYVGRAIGTVKAAKWEKQFPQDLAKEHIKLLTAVLPQDQYAFDHVVANIRTAVSEWLWLNVLTHKDVDEAVESLANYFLLRNGEFALSLIREIERLKLSRLTGKSVPSTMIREQDLHLALLRASLGTTAQQDPSLAHLHFRLPAGPIRPLLPSLAAAPAKDLSSSLSSPAEPTTFDDLLLGTPLILMYNVTWPLNLFLHTSDLQIYAALFSYLSALRKTHTRIHTCWTALSNAQRARRRWTGLGEGGTAEDLEARKQLLRCGWGVVREMNWFLDTLLGYVMTDVVDVEFRRLKGLLSGRPSNGIGRQMTGSGTAAGLGSGGGVDGGPSVPLGTSKTSTFHPSQSTASNLSSGIPPLDFTTLRGIHTTYLERLVTGSLLSNPALTNIIRMILEVCERFAAQIERWGGDVLPALLFEGSIATRENRVGDMVSERYAIVGEIDETLHMLLDAFYEQLSLSTTLQPFSATSDATKSVIYNASTTGIMGNTTGLGLGFNTFVRARRGKRLEGYEEVRRHVERLLLRLDFNGQFSKPRARRRPQDNVHAGEEDILRQGGLA